MRWIFAMLLLNGCRTASYVAPATTFAPANHHPYEIEYELLERVSAEACDDSAGVAEQNARYTALGKVTHADELIAVRVARKPGDKWCVEVSGRAVRYQSVRAVGEQTREDRRPVTPRNAGDQKVAEPVSPAPAAAPPPAKSNKSDQLLLN